MRREAGAEDMFLAVVKQNGCRCRLGEDIGVGRANLGRLGCSEECEVCEVCRGARDERARHEIKRCRLVRGASGMRRRGSGAGLSRRIVGGWAGGDDGSGGEPGERNRELGDGEGRAEDGRWLEDGVCVTPRCGGRRREIAGFC